jgi:hypothetical protein
VLCVGVISEMPPFRRHLGVGYGHTTWNTREEERALAIADWLAAICFLVLPARWVALEIRRRRPSPGRCAVCGYDLRATPDRCPECGTAAGGAGAAAEPGPAEPIAPRPPAR